jgi:hypothetical protein
MAWMSPTGSRWVRRPFRCNHHHLCGAKAPPACGRGLCFFLAVSVQKRAHCPAGDAHQSGRLSKGSRIWHNDLRAVTEIPECPISGLLRRFFGRTAGRGVMARRVGGSSEKNGPGCCPFPGSSFDILSQHSGQQVHIHLMTGANQNRDENERTEFPSPITALRTAGPLRDRWHRRADLGALHGNHGCGFDRNGRTVGIRSAPARSAGGSPGIFAGRVEPGSDGRSDPSHARSARCLNRP